MLPKGLLLALGPCPRVPQHLGRKPCHADIVEQTGVNDFDRVFHTRHHAEGYLSAQHGDVHAVAGQIVGLVRLQAAVDQAVVSQKVRVHPLRKQPAAVHVGVTRFAHRREGLLYVRASFFVQAIRCEGIRRSCSNLLVGIGGGRLLGGIRCQVREPRSAEARQNQVARVRAIRERRWILHISYGPGKSLQGCTHFRGQLGLPKHDDKSPVSGITHLVAHPVPSNVVSDLRCGVRRTHASTAYPRKFRARAESEVLASSGMHTKFLLLAAISAFIGVAAGAFGAHGLEPKLSADLLAVYETGVRYELFHAVALLFVGLAADRWPNAGWGRAGWMFVAGTVLFSGSLYLLALTGARWLGAVTPLGGACFLLGWFFAAAASLRSASSDSEQG